MKGQTEKMKGKEGGRKRGKEGGKEGGTEGRKDKEVRLTHVDGEEKQDSEEGSLAGVDTLGED